MGLEDDEDHVVYGSPLIDEEGLGQRKGKLIIQKGQARHLAPWKQEVTDAEGRRRFHGAFAGGFSAGYYNTVGSKEGWAPAKFTSSRNRRAEKKEQTVYEFLDEDEKEELKLKELVPSLEYNAIGSTAAELALRGATEEDKLWSSVVPGLVSDEINPVSQSVGLKLLRKMGWRQDISLDEGVAIPLVVTNRHGLGVQTLKSETEDLAEINPLEDDVENGRNIIPKRSTSEALGKKEDCLPSFTAATSSSFTSQPLKLPNLVVPVDFTARHVLPAPLDVEQYLSGPEPPEVPSPDDKTTKAINVVAVFVARSGQKFEDILKQKHSKSPEFTFLFEGGTGHEYYVRKLWEEQRSLSMQGKKQILSRSDNSRAELDRGKILGERPLPRTEINRREEFSALVRSEAFSELTAQMNTRFTSGGSDKIVNPDVLQSGNLQPSSDISDSLPRPIRVETPWRPTSLLCKRCNIHDPYMGVQTVPPKPRSNTEAFTIMENLSRTITHTSSDVAPKGPSASAAEVSITEDTRDTIVSEGAVDLYKAIFSDDEEEDEDQVARPMPIGRQLPDTKQSDKASPSSNYKKAAGDFLESLGKELGLRV